jgi:hypothetical protein
MPNTTPNYKNYAQIHKQIQQHDFQSLKQLNASTDAGSLYVPNSLSEYLQYANKQINNDK